MFVEFRDGSLWIPAKVESVDISLKTCSVKIGNALFEMPFVSVFSFLYHRMLLVLSYLQINGSYIFILFSIFFWTFVYFILFSFVLLYVFASCSEIFLMQLKQIQLIIFLSTVHTSKTNQRIQRNRVFKNITIFCPILAI